MQIMEKTGIEVSEELAIENVDLTNPECNIKIGSRYLKKLLEYYDNNIYLTIAAYNAGMGTVAKWIENGIIRQDGNDIENVPYKETNNYIRKVLKNYRMYKELY